MDEQQKYEKARERVQEIKGFYIHALIYVIVNATLFLLNIVASPDEWWFYWSLLGWGVGLGAHGLSIFGSNLIFGANWEERKIQEILRKEERNKSS